MVTQIELGDVRVEVVRKQIKNLHLSVHPPFGRVTIAAPERMAIDNVRLFAITRLSWIRRQQKKLREQERETAREYIERESHYVWGKRYLLRIIERDGAPAVAVTPRRLQLYVRPGVDAMHRRDVLEGWYRSQLKDAVAPLLVKWESRLGVRVNRCFVQRMKTKWGGCHHRNRNIRLNTELAKKPEEFLEYVLVHEMAHLLEPTHSARFIALMDRHWPQWRMHRDALNELPLRDEGWGRFS